MKKCNNGSISNNRSLCAASNTTINKLWKWFLQNVALCILFIHCANALSCYRCGSLSPNVRKIQDCVGPYGIEECSTDEACVVFKRLYKRGSESIRMLSEKSDTARIERISYPTKITLLIFTKKKISSKGMHVYVEFVQ